MPVVINEVIVRAIISGDENNATTESAEHASSETIASVAKNELLDLIDEVIKDKKER